MLGLSYCLYQKKTHEGKESYEMVGLTKNVNQANAWQAEDPENRYSGYYGSIVPEITRKQLEKIEPGLTDAYLKEVDDSLNARFDSIEKTSEESMHKKVKKPEPVKKAVVKHLKEDIKESKESIKDDKKLSKKMKKGKC